RAYPLLRLNARCRILIIGHLAQQFSDVPARHLDRPRRAEAADRDPALPPANPVFQAEGLGAARAAANAKADDRVIPQHIARHHGVDAALRKGSLFGHGLPPGMLAASEWATSGLPQEQVPMAPGDVNCLPEAPLYQ